MKNLKLFKMTLVTLITLTLTSIATAATTPVIKDFNQGCITSNNSSSPTTCKTDGPSGGGGGYGGPNSHAILKYVADELKRHILNASPQIFANLPEGWTQENYAALFDYDNIKKRPNVMKIRPEAGNRPIMFSAETSKEGHTQIVAYQWFFQTFDSYAVISEEDRRLKEEYGVSWDIAKKDPEEYRSKLNDVKEKLLHESAHFFNIGRTPETNSLATVFARRVAETIQKDMLQCTLAQRTNPYGINLVPIKIHERFKYRVDKFETNLPRSHDDPKVGFLLDRCPESPNANIKCTRTYMYPKEIVFTLNRAMGLGIVDVQFEHEDPLSQSELPHIFGDVNNSAFGAKGLLKNRYGIVYKAYYGLPEVRDRLGYDIENSLAGQGLLAYKDYNKTKVTSDTISFQTHARYTGRLSNLLPDRQVEILEEIEVPRTLPNSNKVRGEYRVKYKSPKVEINKVDTCNYLGTSRSPEEEQRCFTFSERPPIEQESGILCEAKFKVLEFSDLLPK